MTNDALLTQIYQSMQKIQAEQEKTNITLAENAVRAEEFKKYMHITDALQKQTTEAKGAMNLIKLVAVFIASLGITFGVWVTKNLHEHDTEIQKIKAEKHAGAKKHEHNQKQKNPHN